MPLTYTRPAGIYQFQGDYRFLSNFYIEVDGTHVEGAYQQAKCADSLERKLFYDVFGKLLPPSDCRRIGRTCIQIRPDWDDVKVEIMHFHVRKKFWDHVSLARPLEKTHPWHLEEANDHGDRFWGSVQGRGQNMLGAILMEVRRELLEIPF